MILVIIQRLFAASMGGFFGSGAMFLIYLLNTYIIDKPENLINEFFLIFMVFIGSLVANLFAGLFLSMAYAEKYSRRTTMIWQAFHVNLFLFLVTFPFYTLVLEQLNTIALFHVFFSVMASNIVYEIFSGDGSYSLTGLYGSLFGNFILFVGLILLETSTFESVLVFSLLPISWFVITFLTIVTERIYSAFYQFYGVAILDPKKNFN